MSKHSVAEAKNNLPKLIARAQKGEVIVITRHGEEVAELRARTPVARPITKEAVEWLAKHRVAGHGKAAGKKPWPNAGELVSAMRDEDWR
jgi:antitoxin (DNA-binding transcriptional repressor) of toxin-antitoxin stability system